MFAQVARQVDISDGLPHGVVVSSPVDTHRIKLVYGVFEGLSLTLNADFHLSTQLLIHLEVLDL